MTQLESILNHLSSEKVKIQFLKSAYTVGNTEVADNLLTLVLNKNDLNSDITIFAEDVADSEIEHAQSTEDNDRVNTLQKQLTNHYIKVRSHHSLQKDIIKWNNPILVEYAIDLLSTHQENKEENLRCAAEIAEVFKKDNIATQIYTKILSIEKDGSSFTQAITNAKLKKFDKAIDLYKQSDYSCMQYAISIAREHKPERLNEVAQHIFDNYKSEFHEQKMLIEVASIIGKTKEAKIILKEESEILKPQSPPWVYNELISVLIDLEMNDEAKRAVNKIAEHETSLFKKDSHHDFYDQGHFSNQDELEELFKKVGYTVPTKENYLIKIEVGLKNDLSLSWLNKYAEEAFQATNDPIFLEKKIIILEQQSDYKGAQIVANRLKKPEVAKIYSIMDKMT